MEKTQIKIKYNVNFYKWFLTIFFLVGNIALVGVGSGHDLFFIIWGIVVNCLALSTFILLSIFPRWYYIINIDGVSLQDRYGKEKEYIAWDDAESIYYIYTCGIIPDGMRVKYLICGVSKEFRLALSLKQAKLLYETFPNIKDIIKKSGNYNSF